MKTIKQNLINVKNRIIEVANKCHRSTEDIILLAVSKNKSCNAIQEAINAGQYQFGENYLQEGIKKIIFFSKTQHLIWHFIGSLQSNKSRLVAEYFDWCHTIDRFKIAQRLNNQRPINKNPLNVLIQINVSNEISKSGIMMEELNKLASEIVLLPNLKLRGLMIIPKQNNELNKQILIFRSIEILFNQLKKQYSNIDTLSMGMTSDFNITIPYGSTLVRIGKAIFDLK
ncbi:MAG: YggS family pyridoxal phosphate-dependent enzyme [Arsenophonus sp. ET-YP4-MAG3]